MRRDRSRQITSAAGVSDQRRFYLPYGAVSLSTVAVTNPAPDTKGWIGERFDADAGLQYLNARYYDPQLGMFLQPDWWEVMQPGVGTNRYSYSFGDPVNGIDPTGHSCMRQTSGHCDRSTEYEKMSLYSKIKKETSFLAAAASVTWALGDIDRTKSAQNTWGGKDLVASDGVRSFFEKVGKKLYSENKAIVNKLLLGKNVLNLDPKNTSKKDLDRAWVRYEQGLVETMIQNLKKQDADLYRDVVRYGNASIAALQENYLPWMTNPSQAQAALEVKERLGGEPWDFANYDHRVLMGYVATDLARLDMEE